ncbi:MAG: HAD family phosphatase [Planctomycetes bacterium]|nr:HAD family phosphatase [Planctomycetota bacterium]
MPAIIFDFDGVIVDSEPLHEAALLQCARERAMSFTHEQYMSKLIGLADRDCLPVLYQLNGRTPSADEHASFFKQKKFLVHEMIERGEAKGFPGTLALIRAAAARVPLAVCSGAIRPEIETVLKAFGIIGSFRAIVSADDVRQSKPEPEGYLKACAALETSPSQCVAIEDTPTGCRAALAAGLRIIAVGHSLPREAFPASIADFVPSTAELDLGRALRAIDPSGSRQ